MNKILSSSSGSSSASISVRLILLILLLLLTTNRSQVHALSLRMNNGGNNFNNNNYLESLSKGSSSFYGYSKSTSSQYYSPYNTTEEVGTAPPEQEYQTEDQATQGSSYLDYLSRPVDYQRVYSGLPTNNNIEQVQPRQQNKMPQPPETPPPMSYLFDEENYNNNNKQGGPDGSTNVATRTPTPTQTFPTTGDAWQDFRIRWSQKYGQPLSPETEQELKQQWELGAISIEQLLFDFEQAQINLMEQGNINWNEAFNDVLRMQGEFLRSSTQAFAQTARNVIRKTTTGIPPKPGLDTVGMTQRIMSRLPVQPQANGAGGTSTWEAFLRAEENWSKLKKLYPHKLTKFAPPQFVVTDPAKGNPQAWAKLQAQWDTELDYDITVCGGTLGIFFATALLLKGHRVAVLEGGRLRGREQEWNISMEELMELVRLGVLGQDDIDAAITTEFPGCRSGFKNKEITPLNGGYFDNDVGFECFTEGVLNLGVSPAILLDRAAQRFVAFGGTILEEARLQGVAVADAIGAAIDLGPNKEPITSSIVLDCMGNASPITRQQRFGLKPDGICAVVGSCAGGFDRDTNIIGDIIYTNTEIQDNGRFGRNQYFWEAFPVGIGRNGNAPGTSDVKTTYMFTYMDAHQRRPSLETLMEDYWRLLPIYQPSIQNPETDLDVKRVLFAYFPTYRDSPLKPQWDRILPIGDASGIQSPLSFGGFGAMTRHLDRISSAVDDALQANLLSKEELGEINAYTPNLSAAWMFQKAMSVRMGQRVDPKFVNRLLATNFQVMDELGPRTIKPFLQDVVRFDGLVASLTRSFVADPSFMPQIVAHVGLPTLVDWIGHVSMMGAYGLLDSYVSPFISPVFEAALKNDKKKFLWRRRMEAWKYGSGNDYKFSDDRN